MTRKGYSIYRTPVGNGFVVKQESMSFDPVSNTCFRSEQDHASLYLPFGISKSDAWKMLAGWLTFFDDEELIQMCWSELCSLYQPAVPQLLPPDSDDKDMN